MGKDMKRHLIKEEIEIQIIAQKDVQHQPLGKCKIKPQWS